MTGTTLTDRALIRVSGAEAHDFLQGLVTQDVPRDGDGPRWGGLLTPQGKVLFDFILWPDGEDVLIDCEAARADALIRRLSMYRLRRPVTIAAEPTLAVHWAVGGDAGVPDPRLPALGRRWLAPAGAAALGWDAHRLSLGVTEGVAELGDGTTLWLECNARELNGVSFTKGCYVGQENTARMHHRSKVNRRLLVRPMAEVGDAARVTDPERGLAVVHARLEAVPPSALPGWVTPTTEGDEA
ncbi:hypothetical protein GGR88_002102 [Sphingomonas jejuensis]|uniref:Aminomethyltransferase folate-binding domain-containing protein n=1 Tax=Sphingomonas jejuensis TaxID=904715 RepID=A0ABX0XMI5_9SPHN|nr:folate-binding protein YgfZ [Sphingomonas jejuensis]NJC34588.1 hypothetical protein [Sphingomonas jejuensis]